MTTIVGARLRFAALCCAVSLSANGAPTLSPGAAQSPNTTLIASTDDWMNIATGKLNPVTAFMQQKLKVKGDMGLAMKLQGLLQ